MASDTGPIKVRIIGEPGRQLVGAAVTVALLVGVVVWTKRRHYGPLVATRTARRLRLIAQRLEDAGLNLARKDAP